MILLVMPEGVNAFATTDEEFCDANADFDDGVCDEVRSLTVSESIRFGGGAAPYVVVMRLA